MGHPDQDRINIESVLRNNTDVERLGIELVLAEQLKLSRAQLLGRTDQALSNAQAQAIDLAIERLRQGEPVAYLLGRKEFWGLQLVVNTHVLIPRPDTELLVELTLAHLPNKTANILELGTGSGAIAVALASEGYLNITATDLSVRALGTAQTNARAHDAAIKFINSDWFAAVDLESHGSFDLIVANPPYIASEDAHLANLGFEPSQALVSGHDGLDAIRAILAQCVAFMNPRAWIMLEHGFDQHEQVTQLMHQAGLSNIQTHADLGGQMRVTTGCVK